ncbi:MAG: DEAD/DEAH box helicase [Holosporales bacterium]|nr:DEAD/DEAH box helicase [Holosporales bacterium]
MKPESKSFHLLNITKSKAKMWEYAVPIQHHISIAEPPDKLFPLSISLLGDVAAEINRGHEDADSFMELKKSLLFSAEFFNSFYEAKLLETLSPKLRLLTSAAYYLCDMPGNAKVAADSMQYNELDASDGGLSFLLLWILQGNTAPAWKEFSGDYSYFVINIPLALLDFYHNGNPETVLELVSNLRNKVYANGTDEQLLLGDIISAVTRNRIKNASITVLSDYTGIDVAKWQSALTKQTFIKEFWPAQHLLGEAGVLSGKSAVVQMPTSAGKTRAMELILRSAFLSKRANLAVIIAPFRALCNEIMDSFKDAFNGESVDIDVISDVFQNDFMKLLGLPTKPQILVVTPEKLLYVLRHTPVIATQLGLIIFDEGHQFDTESRGIAYELLLTSLKRLILAEVQKVLISAVIPNAEKIGIWLNGDDTVAKGISLLPTSKSIGFVSWPDTLGQIKYVENAKETFFVPRVIETHSLRLQGREQKPRYFPERNNGQDIALFLGLKLCRNGGVAIFCGYKNTAVKICTRAVEIVDRGYQATNLTDISNQEEILAITRLCQQNLGTESIEAKSAKLGVFAHHNNIPHGIRLAVEHAMREDKIRIVICTSTLAQGVNLPIRYLIVTSLYQGGVPIKVRDFHNLIGRAGRSGKHIEGSILFADSDIYDNRTIVNETRKWKKALDLLDFNNSEDCISSLLEIFEPIQNKKKDQHKTLPEETQSFEAIIDAYIKDEIKNLAENISQKHQADGFDFGTVFAQLFRKRQLLESLENFLLAHWEYDENGQDWVAELARETLAFHLADTEKQTQIIRIFHLLSANIAQKVPEQERKKAYGKTLYGIKNASTIEAWVDNNTIELLSVDDLTTFVEITWQLLCEIIKNNTTRGVFTKFDPPEPRKKLLRSWLDGRPYVELLKLLQDSNVHKIHGSQRRKFAVEDMVDICEKTFAFDGTLVVGAITEFLESIDGFDQSVKDRFQFFQKCLRYGLPSLSSINVYELGFADRVLAQKIASLFQNQNCNKDDVLQLINNADIFRSIQELNMPSYYQLKLQSLQVGI